MLIGCLQQLRRALTADKSSKVRQHTHTHLVKDIFWQEEEASLDETNCQKRSNDDICKK